MDHLVLLGQLLQTRRLHLGYSQRALADKCGIGPRTIARLEAGLIKRPRQTTLRQIADCLEIPWSQVMPYILHGITSLERVVELAGQVPSDRLWILEGVAMILIAGPPVQD